jgi:hypothetical protein
MSDIQQLLKNASAKELRTLTNSMTPYVSGKNPPQILILNKNSISILEKYGILKKGVTNQTDKTQTPLGIIGVNTVSTSDKQIETKYIIPDVGVRSDETTFDIITAMTVQSSQKETIVNLRQKLIDGYKKQNFFLQSIEVIDDQGNAQEITAFVEKDPVETERQKKDNPKLPSQLKFADGIQFTTFGANTNEFSIQAYANLIDELNKQDEYRKMTNPVSPRSEFSGYFAEAERVAQLLKEGKLNIDDKITAIGINATLIKLSNFAGQLDYKNFIPDIADATTWGGLTHNAKTFFTSVRNTYYVGKIGYYTYDALNKLHNNDPEGALESFEDAALYFYKEFIFVPLVNKGSEGIADIITAGARPVSETYPGISAGRGKNIITNATKQFLKNSKQEEFIKTLKKPTLSAAQRAAAAEELGKALRKQRIQFKAGLIGLGYYMSKYIVAPIFEDDVILTEREVELRQLAKKVGTTQVGLYVKTGGAVRVGPNMKVVSPYTGQLLNLKLPSLEGSPTPGFSLGISNIRVNDRNAYEWFKYGIVHGTSAITNLIETAPPNIEYLALLQGLKDTPGIVKNTGNFIIKGSNAIEYGIRKLGSWNWVNQPFAESVSPQTPGVLQRVTTKLSSAIEPTLERVANSSAGRALGTMAGSSWNWISEKATWLGEKFGGIKTTAVLMFLTDPTTMGDGTLDGHYRRELDRLRTALRTGTYLIENTSGRYGTLGTPLKAGNNYDGIEKKQFQATIEELQKLELEEIQRMIQILEGAIKRSDEIKKSHGELLTPDMDPSLNSSTHLFGEIEAAKSDYRMYAQIVSDLEKVGDLYQTGTSYVPNVAIENINQNASFVTGIDNKFYSALNTGITAVGGGSGPGCFPSYVSIKTENGYINISNLKVGDYVISFNQNGDFETDIVTETFIHKNKNVYRYCFENATSIDVTKEHPFLTRNGIFEEIGNLNIGDTVIDVFNKELKIIDIQFLFETTVYNIEVGKNHTYIADNIRVHNKLGQDYMIGNRRETNQSVLAVLKDFDLMRQSHEDWIDENFPGTLQDGFPYIPDSYPSLGVIGEPPTETHPSNEPPDSGPPSGGTIPETDPNGDDPVASGTRNIPKEILFEGCFSSNSIIETPNGNLKIIDVNVGDEIYVYDQIGNKEISIVDKKFIHNKHKLVNYITESGYVLCATNNHSVLTNDDNVICFRKLIDLGVNDVLYLNSFVPTKIVEIQNHIEDAVYHIIPENGKLISVNSFLVDTMEIII